MSSIAPEETLGPGPERLPVCVCCKNGQATRMANLNRRHSEDVAVPFFTSTWSYTPGLGLHCSYVSIHPEAKPYMLGW